MRLRDVLAGLSAASCASAAKPGFAACARGDAAGGDAPGEKSADGKEPLGGEAPGSSAPGRFQMLYESRDGRLCLFENADGHLSAIDATRLV